MLRLCTAGTWIRAVQCVLVSVVCGLVPTFSIAQVSDATPSAQAIATPTVAPSALPVEDENTPPDRILFDIYLVDSFQGGVLANYTPRWLEIENPQDVIDQIKELRPDRAADLLPLLTGRINGAREIAGVGRVTFDIFTFRIIITLSPELLKSAPLKLTNRIPDPEGGFSVQQSVGVAASGEVSGENNSAFSHRTILGSGKYFGRLNGTAVNSRPYQLTEASALGYVGDYEVGAGFLETPGFSFANSLQYTGARFRTSEQILLDPDHATGSRLEVFVPSRSRVEFYRSDRLLAAQILDFGIQEIDTSGFPQGSYDIDIVIIQSNGSVQRDRKFFTKSGYLAIRGRPSYQFDLGAIRKEFQTDSGSAVYQAGVRWRALSEADVGASVIGTDKLTIGQTDLTALYRENYLHTSLAGSSDGDTGVAASFSTTLLGVGLNIGATKTLHSSSTSLAITPTPTPNPAIPTLIAPQSSRITELLFQDRSTYQATARRSFGSIDLSYQLQRDQYRNSDDRYSYGPSLEWRINENTKNALRYMISRFETNNGSVLNNSLRYRYRLAPQWSLGAQLGAFHRSTNSDSVSANEYVGYLSINYSPPSRGQSGSRLDLSSEARHVSASEGGQGAGTVITNQLTGDYSGSYAKTGVFLREQSGGVAGKSSYGVNAESSVLLSSDGASALSYPIGEEAVFIADIQSTVPDAKFDILLNDQVYDTVLAGKRSAVGVHPFRTYRINIRPVEGTDLINFDNAVYTVTFFPGNVVRKTWHAYKVSIVIGRLVDSDGKPMPFQRIKGTHDYVATDELGNFQAELEGNEKLSVEANEHHCVITLPPLAATQFVTDLHDVSCVSQG